MDEANNGRTMATKSISMSPQMIADIDGRVNALKPLVSSVSHYIQLLIAYDLEHDVLGEMFGREVIQQKQPRHPSASGSEELTPQRKKRVSEGAKHTAASLPRSKH